MVTLLRDVMHLRVNFEDDTTIEFSTTEDDRFQVFGAGDPYSEFLDRHAHGPVPLFEVDDAQRAKAELEASEVEVIGNVMSDAHWNWIHFRGPDGNLYELGGRRSQG